jgi:chromosome segregation ATPase
MQVKMKDFLTFEKATVRPGPGLNLFIGPNGSGKSSIVAAIGLCLGGSVKDVGRGTPLVDYIRRGTNKLKIKVQLREEPFLWISREVERKGESDERATTLWHMKRSNGWKTTTGTAVIQIVSDLNIQLDNLCMFLPQERVKEFAGLSSDKLLESTEQAIDRDLFTMHVDLQAQCRALKILVEESATAHRALEQQRDTAHLLEAEVQRLQQYDQAKTRLENLEKKQWWAAVAGAEEVMLAAKAGLQQATAAYQGASQERMKELAENLEQKRTERTQLAKRREGLATARRGVEKVDKDFTANQNSISSATGRLDSFEAERKRLMAEIETCKGIMGKVTNVEEIQQRVAELEKQRRAINTEVTKARAVEDELGRDRDQVDAKIKKNRGKVAAIQADIELSSKAQEGVMRAIYRKAGKKVAEEIRALVGWVEEHRSELSGPVYGPFAAEIVPRNIPEAGNIIEHVIEKHLLYAFTTEKECDYQLLWGFCEKSTINRVTIVRPPPQLRELVLPDLRHLGFAQCVNDLFDAPEFLRQLLGQISGFNKIPIHNGKLKEKQEELNEQLRRERVDRYVLGAQQQHVCYTMYRAKFGPGVTVAASSVRESQLWSKTELGAGEGQTAELREKMAKKQEKMGRLEEELRVSREKVAAWRKEVQRLKGLGEELGNECQKLRGLIELAEKTKAKRDAAEKQLTEIPEQEAETRAKLRGLFEERVKLHGHSVGASKKLALAAIEADKMAIDERAINDRISDLEEQIEQEKGRLKELELAVGRALDLKKDATAKYKKTLATARDKCPLTPELEKIFEGLPSATADILSEMAQLKLRLQRTRNIDRRVIKRYETAKRLAEEWGLKEREATAKLNEANALIAQLFQDWRRRLIECLGSISGAFERLMEDCGYRGKVDLECDEENKLESYRLALRVAFTAGGELKRLTDGRQSGGEKSVSTVLYLLALQDCTKFPFRIVDEINQGMDEINDRNTFGKIVSIIMNRPEPTQYFIVTPKLLETIKLIQGITVMVVCNGPCISDELKAEVGFLT